MTTPITPRKDGSRLMEYVIASLESEPRQTAEAMADQLGFGISAVRIRLAELHDAGRAKFTLAPGKTAFARVKLWELTESDSDVVMGKSSTMEPRQATVRNYPTINRRDDLVAALFGPAHKEAA